jgi:hypothetical protein
MLIRRRPHFLAGLAVLSGALAACASDEPSASDMSVAPLITDRAARGLADCPTEESVAPDELRCTGLYEDWTSRKIDPRAVPYGPAFDLWSDGAKKTRFIYLPEGSTIDARDMNAWVFPVGTKLWKEFRLPLEQGGKTLSQVETRMLHKVAADKWVFATYVWSADQSSARRVTNGIMPLPGTTNYEVPSERTCMRCHAGRKDHVLGFEAVLLSGPEATGLRYADLVDSGRLTTNGPPPPASALQIPGNGVERDAIGRLHANCGIACHNAGGPAPFSMRLEITDGHAPDGVADTSVFRQAIGQESFFSPAGGEGTYYRIRPTDEEGSMVFYRLSHRDGPGGFEQMPPVATHRPDPALVDSVRTWIRSMTNAPYPAPGPR